VLSRPLVLEAPAPPASDNPFEFEGAPETEMSRAEPISASPMSPQSVPSTARIPAGRKSPPSVPATATPSGGNPAVIVEVTGQAVELLPDDEVRLLDGTTMFRLHRAWVYAATKLADETMRTAYLPLQRIDVAILDQRFETGRKKGEPHSLLIFYSGSFATGLVFQGNDKPYRSFLEKVLLVANPTKHGGK